jgi:uncharacterized protein YbaR (Trm112 family)
MPVAPELKEILACPQCKGELEFREAGGSPAGRAEPEGRSTGGAGGGAEPEARSTEGAEGEIVCRKCRLVYRIEDDIPVMLVDEARPLEG